MAERASCGVGASGNRHRGGDREALAAAMRALSDSSREALILRDAEGLSAEETAAVAGIEVGALESRLHRIGS